MKTEIKVGDLVEYCRGGFICNPELVGVQARVLEIDNSGVATLDFKFTPQSPKYKAYIANLKIIKSREKKWRM